jgi:hypothetical protein
VDVVLDARLLVVDAPGERFALPEPEDEHEPSRHAHTQSTIDKGRRLTTNV